MGIETICISVDEYKKHVKNEIMMEMLFNYLNNDKVLYLYKEDIYDLLGASELANEVRRKREEELKK